MLPTLSAVLGLPVLAAGRPRVVAGAEHLGHEVRWAHVAEVADISELLRGNELILTTGVALPRTDDGIVAFVQGLAALPVAGLVVELGRAYAGRLPTAMVRAAERFGLPAGRADPAGGVHRGHRGRALADHRRPDQLAAPGAVAARDVHRARRRGGGHRRGGPPGGPDGRRPRGPRDAQPPGRRARRGRHGRGRPALPVAAALARRARRGTRRGRPGVRLGGRDGRCARRGLGAAGAGARRRRPASARPDARRAHGHHAGAAAADHPGPRGPGAADPPHPAHRADGAPAPGRRDRAAGPGAGGHAGRTSAAGRRRPLARGPVGDHARHPGPAA